MRQHFPQKITVRYGLHNISYMAPKIWNFLPKGMRKVTTNLNKFKPKGQNTVPADSVDLTFHR